MKIDASSLRAVREYLDTMMYSLVDFRLSLEAPPGPTGFPAFEALSRVIARLDPTERVIFNLLRLGDTVSDPLLRSALPAPVVTAFVRAGMLVRTDEGGWRTPNLLLLPVEGLLVLVSIPTSYPTRSAPPEVWFDLSSFVVARAIPSRLSGERVLDVCSGSGVLALICAARGAELVVALELSEAAVGVARANAVLNGLDARVEFRGSDMLAALGEDEQFDRVIANVPHAPVVPRGEPPTGLESIGNAVVWPLLEKLPRHLSAHCRGVLAGWRVAGHRASTYQMHAIAARLEAAGCGVFAYVDRAPDSVNGVLEILQRDLVERFGRTSNDAAAIAARTRSLLERGESPVDGFYNQLLCFRKGGFPSIPARAIFGFAPPAAEGTT